ncbi:MAG TPA: NTP transferase domain-containing protein [Nocardioides sp.]|nr:NTP transferase domain-containing protein [Nocardioides sp.]
MDVAAVILAGGTAARLDGADKASLEYGGSTFLERALSAARAAGEVVVVGDAVPTTRPATFVREDPPLGGPVAGIVAGRSALAHEPDTVVVLAVDMPFVSVDTVARLLEAAAGRDGAVLCDADGRPRLVAALSLAALDAAAPADPHGASVRALLAPLDLARVAAVGEEARGVDTWRDLRDLPR